MYISLPLQVLSIKYLKAYETKTNHLTQLKKHIKIIITFYYNKYFQIT